jgi:hypothetical protein
MDCREEADAMSRLLIRVSWILYDLNSIANINLIYLLNIQKFTLREIFKTLTSYIYVRILPHVPVTKYEDACCILYCYKQSILITVVK